VEITPQGYSFAQRRGGERIALEDGPFGSEPWEQETRVAVGEVESPTRVAFDPTGATDAREIVLERGEGRVRVTLDLAGEVRVHAPNG
jgi:hypothetical protein